ncbi:MAG: hypothetical protein H7844_03090 [Nitrospirae bacterium YQR-1]
MRVFMMSFLLISALLLGLFGNGMAMMGDGAAGGMGNGGGAMGSGGMGSGGGIGFSMGQGMGNGGGMGQGMCNGGPGGMMEQCSNQIPPDNKTKSDMKNGAHLH